MNKQTIQEYKASITKRGRTKKFNTYNYTTTNRLAGKCEYQSRVK